MGSIPPLNYTLKSQSLSSHTTLIPSPSPNSTATFPILAIALLCILATALLLVIYYLILTKPCVNLQQFDPLHPQSPPMASSMPATWHTDGLSQTLLRNIPILRYTKTEGEKRALFECAVCLNEFENNDFLRILPKCGHGFHLDCVDVWLQSNANCPTCRGGISGRTRYPLDRIVAPPNDEDYVVIELGENRGSEWKKQVRNWRKCRHGSMMGDEGIEMRENAIRRSFSMDSVADQSVFLAVREGFREGERNRGEGNSSGRVRRSFFSFRQRSSVLPVEF